MAHYAFIDENNIVVNTIVGIDEDDTTKLPDEYSSWEEFYSAQKGGMTCLRTSYNTQHNQHKLGGTPFRGNYGGKGSTYDAENDIFIPVKPALLDSWIFDVSQAKWIPPIDLPPDREFESTAWIEEHTTWQDPETLQIWNNESQQWEDLP